MRSADAIRGAPVEVRIDELVVTGFPLAHPERLAPAVEAALSARLAAAPPPPGPARRADPVVVATSELAGTGVEDLAGAVAATVDRTIRSRLGGGA